MTLTVITYWTAENGVLVNPRSGQNLRTEAEFEDFRLRLEFNCPAGSNSGVFLRGRYEVQIEAAPKNPSQGAGSLGAICGYIAPRVPVADRPGEWRTLEATLIGRTVTVALDGVTIIEGEEIPGPTGGNFNPREAEPGPLILQGDHGPVSYRDIVLTPAVRRPPLAVGLGHGNAGALGEQEAPQRAQVVQNAAARGHVE